MAIKSFSKINLSLRVTKKLSNGLHNLQSYFCLIDLHDLIKIKKIKGTKHLVKFSGKFSKHVNKKENSILNTLKILESNRLIFNNYSIDVKKNVPAFSGLGGGTSNAVFLLKYFIKKKNKKIAKISRILSENIGSDVKLFFQNQGFLKNINEINTFKKKHKVHFLLVFPNIKCSTKYIYSKVKKFSTNSEFSFNQINKKDKFLYYLKNSTNDLQLIVEKKHNRIKKLILRIGQLEGCVFSRMTGSGSVCYGVFQSKNSAKKALNTIKRIYPKYWSVIAKTI